MTRVDVSVLRDVLERRSGLDLGRGGMEVNLVNFVRQRLAANGLTFERYLQQIEVPGNEELRLLIEAMTVIYTWFFRDPGQFCVIEELIRNFTSDRAMSIWVAGCATGEEAYSVALVAAAVGKRIHVLGTDLNSAAVAHAQKGQYAAGNLGAVEAEMRARYLNDVEGDFVVPPAVRQSVRFQVGNLVESPPRAPTSEGWDLVICRNVLIYFSQTQARRALDTLAASLAPGGILVLGASEAILERPTNLDLVAIGGRSVLERPTRRGTGCVANLVHSMVNHSPPSHSHLHALPAAIPGRVAGDTLRDKGTKSNSGIIAAVRSDQPAPTRDPDSAAMAGAKVLLQQGCVALDLGNVPTARELCLRAMQLDPTCAEASMFAGIAQYLEGDFEGALRLLRGALCLDPTLWVACFYQALCFENMGHAEDAANCYALAIRIVDRRADNGEDHPFLRNWRDEMLTVAHKRARNRSPLGESRSRRLRV